MFLKLVGALTVVVSSFIMGWYISLSSEFRRDDLLSIKGLLTRFMSQLSYGNALLYEAALNVCDESGGSVIFSVFGEELKKRERGNVFKMWQTAVKKASERLYINSTDIRELNELGKIFSYSDIKIQTKVINSVINYFDEEIKIINADRGKKSKIYRSLGAAIGLFIVIILF